MSPQELNIKHRLLNTKMTLPIEHMQQGDLQLLCVKCGVALFPCQLHWVVHSTTCLLHIDIYLPFVTCHFSFPQGNNLEPGTLKGNCMSMLGMGNTEKEVKCKSGRGGT